MVRDSVLVDNNWLFGQLVQNNNNTIRPVYYYCSFFIVSLTNLKWLYLFSLIYLYNSVTTGFNINLSPPHAFFSRVWSLDDRLLPSSASSKACAAYVTSEVMLNIGRHPLNMKLSEFWTATGYIELIRGQLDSPVPIMRVCVPRATVDWLRMPASNVFRLSSGAE